MKNHIISFLYDPIKVGAYCSRVVVPCDAVIEFWESLSNTAKKEHKRLRIEKPVIDREYYKFMMETGSQEFVEETLDDMLNFLVRLEKLCPKQVAKWGEHGNVVIYPQYFIPEKEEKEGFFFFPPQVYFSDLKDAMSIKIDNKAAPDFVAETATLMPKAQSEFKAFITAIPCFESKVIWLDQGRRHSKRSVFDLYPGVAALWIDEYAHRSVSRDIIEFLSGAIDYLDRRIWQMSIILSAISVEILLADIYEELLKKESPPAPIGYMIKEIEKKKKFPPEAMGPLKVVNTMRRVAVHRGVTTFTQMDAINGLMNATRFILWCAFRSKGFCDIRNESEV